MLLREIAHARTGDKGNIITMSLITYRPEDFPLMEREVTAAKVAEHFSEFVDKPVMRYVVENLNALNFVLYRPATESVTRSLSLDAHGKCLSSAILSMEI